ncbi:MAG TPA: hypothetical protein VK724_06325 [Bryobacteraceae bacterium]|jgi:hypothetical protein|nr:hypothetical protein [Bryobacteraceae bacterium]
MQAAIQTRDSVVRNWRICFILASALSISSQATAEDPPPNLTRLIAARETETEQAQSNYTYRQTVTIDELNANGLTMGTYREIRDIIFSPEKERSEQMVGTPFSTLTHLQMTPEDFRDIRDVQPFLLTKDQAFLYETQFRGEETMDGVDCFVVQIRPRQILDGQRLFDGMLWVSKKDYSVIRSEGHAVPEIRTLKTENLFPHFTTLRQKMEGDFWFPITTYGDDTLYFRGGAQRVRLTIRYSEYHRFGADSKITFDK